MKRMLHLIALLLFACTAIPCFGQALGTMTEDGVTLEVKAAVALLDSSKPTIRFVLLPFQPTAGEIAKLQADDTMWLLEKKSPDVKKWPTWCPYGHFQLSWTLEKEAVGDPKKSWVYIYSFGIGKSGSNLSINKFGGDIDVKLSGTLKEGQEATLTSKGSETVGKSKLDWNLNVKAKILSMKK